MKAQELRIGNLVFDENGNITKVFSLLDDGDIMEINKDFISFRYEPIQLTEEWLLKFGFDIIKFGFARKCDFQIGNIMTEENYQLEYAVGMIGKWMLKDVKYVHQLQNLYFALTGKELELNENL